jgi:hypothetical protein
LAVRSRAARVALAFAALVTAAGGSVTRAATPCDVAGQLTPGRDQWTRIASPSFPTGAGTLTGYAVDPYHPADLYVTDGLGVGASTDGGCHWRLGALPPEDLSALPPLVGDQASAVGKRRIIDVAVPESPYDTGYVWALAATEVVAAGTPLVEPRVFVSTDHGRTYAARTSGLPTFARPVALRPLALPGAAYLLVENTLPRPVRELYVTQNGGAAWQRVATGLPAFVDLAVSSLDPRLLFAWDNGGLQRSADGGRTWNGTTGVTGSPQYVDLAYFRGGFVVTVFTTTRQVRFVSIDGGRSFAERPAPDTVTSVTHGLLDGAYALSSVVDGVTVEPPTFEHHAAWDASPDATVSRLRLSQVLVDGAWQLYAFSPAGLLVRRLPVDLLPPYVPPPPAPPRKYVPLRPPPEPPVKVPTLRPADATVTLRPGERRTVPYRVLLPPDPTPLDVMFLTDSTRSMGSTISSVQASVQQIADELAAAGIDAWFGVADFRDHKMVAPEEPANYPYLRHRPVGPVNAELATALQSLSTGGGTTGGDDSALEAVYQATTGAGRAVAPGLGVPGTYLIEPGQGAEWRKDAAKIVLLASDDEMRHPDADNPGYPGPELTTVTAALRAQGAHLVGIRVRTSEGGDPSADMKRLAVGSGTVAPPGGVDCDGDPETEDDDLGAGEPLVCEFTPGPDTSIAPAFLGLLRGVRDPAAVDVAVTGPRAVVRQLVPERFADVNLKDYNELTVPVEFRCDKARYGTDTPVTVRVASRGRELVRTGATVRCLAPEPPFVPPLPAAVPPAVIALAVVPHPAAPVANAQPNPPNVNPNPNPQLNPNAGMAAAENEELQLAAADDTVPPSEEDYAFSAPSQPVPAAPAVAWALAASMAAAAAYGFRRSLRTSPAYVPAGKEH